MPHIDLRKLIPHQGSMCLLERIIEWDPPRIVLETRSHHAPGNPLRVQGRLRCVHLCEYAAQAIAVHGALRGGAEAAHATPGMLVALRAVRFWRDYIEDLPESLRVEAHCLLADRASLQYDFRVTHAGEPLAEGRAAIVLGPAGGA